MKRALLAVFVPGVMIGVMVAAGVTYLTDLVFWGVLAGLGGVALSFLNIGPLLLGAVLGGLTARLWPVSATSTPDEGGGPPRGEG